MSCSTTKRLKENEYLLVKNEVKIENPHKKISNSDLEGLLQQRPNKKLFGLIPFQLWLNSMFKKAGELPKAVDKSMIAETKKQMNQFLNNSGFYNSEISSELIDRSKRKRKQMVRYNITLSTPYTIRSLNYEIEDDSIKTIIPSKIENSLIKEEAIFNTFTLNDEREKITKYLRDNGYFSFIKENIYYEVDSGLNSRQVDISLKISDYTLQQGLEVDSVQSKNHPIFYVRSISIKPDYIPFGSDSLNTDTLWTEEYYRRRKKTELYKFVYAPPLKIRPKVIARSIFLENDRKFNNTDARQSYQKLNQLRIFKYVDINFYPSDYHSEEYPSRKYLDCNINLVRNPVHSYSIETQGTNSGGDLGIGGYIVYQNKNLFRGGEVFSIKFKGALEAQSSSLDTEADRNKYWIFNTLEAGIEASLYIPKFLAPIDQELFSRYFRPKTMIGLGYNMQDRIEYDRIISNATFGYEWKQPKYKNHIFYPVDINLIKVNTTPEFDSLLNEQSERFKTQYTDHLILGLKYSYIFNNQEINKIQNFHYFRLNFESAGNLLNLAVNSFGKQQVEEGYKTVFGIRYAQFAKANFDFRYYYLIDNKHSLATRAFVGTAIPYGNSNDIPFEKGYFGGGANGMRAWPLRFLGPGAYDDSQNIERVGDIMLEGNLEYRFPIYKVFTGGLFYDIGNIWLLKENETFPGGEFNFDNFISQLAMDIGFGIRLDFNYFIFRVDVAQKLRDPARPVSKRWVIGSGGDWFKVAWNLGIGYPF